MEYQPPKPRQRLHSRETESSAMKTHHVLAMIAAVLVFCAIIFYSVQLGTNDEVKTSVAAFLSEHPEIDATLFKISEAGGVVTISGIVETESMRSLVIEQIKKVDGVEHVVDEIVVAGPKDTGEK